MKIYEKNIFKLLVVNTLISMLVFLTIFVIFEIVGEVNEVNIKDYTFRSILTYTLLKIPFFISKIISLSVLFGAILTIAFLNSNKELTIIQSGSISKALIGKKILKFSFFISVVFVIFVELLNPLQRISENFKSIQLGDLISQNKQQNFWLKSGDYFLFIEDSIDGIVFEGLKIFKFDNNKLITTIYSDRAEIGTNGLHLKNSKIFNLYREKSNIISLDQKNIEDYFLDLKLDKNLQVGFEDDPNLLSVPDIYKKINSLKSNNLDSRDYQINLYSRLLVPFGTIATILFGMPFLFRESRNLDIQKKVFLGLGLGFVFHLANKSIVAVSTKLELGVVFSTVFPIILFIVFGLFLFISRIEHYE